MCKFKKLIYVLPFVALIGVFNLSAAAPKSSPAYDLLIKLFPVNDDGRPILPDGREAGEVLAIKNVRDFLVRTYMQGQLGVAAQLVIPKKPLDLLIKDMNSFVYRKGELQIQAEQRAAALAVQIQKNMELNLSKEYKITGFIITGEKFNFIVKLLGCPMA